MIASRHVCLLATACALAAAGRAHAGAPSGPAGAPVTIASWAAPPECPKERDFEDRVRRGYRRTRDARAGRLAVEVVIHSTPAGYRLSMATREVPHGPTRAKILTGPRCDGVVRAASLVVAMAASGLVSPPGSRELGGGFPRERTVIGAAARREPPEPAEATMRRREIERADVTVAARAVVGGDSGSLPGVGAGVGVVGSALIDDWRIEAAVSRWFESRAVTSAPGSAPVGGDIELVAAAVRSCRELTGDPVGVAGCASLEVGSMGGAGVGVMAPRTDRSPWIAATAGGAVSLELAELVAVRADMETAFPLLAPEFVVRDDRVVHRAAMASVRGFLGMELQFR